MIESVTFTDIELYLDLWFTLPSVARKVKLTGVIVLCYKEGHAFIISVTFSEAIRDCMCAGI